MLTWSTDEFRPHERFDYWREVRGRHLGGVTMDVEPERRAGFEGSFSMMPVGSAMFSEIRSTAYDVSRGAADINRVSTDSLRIAQLIEGPAWTDTRIGRGSMPVSSLSTSYTDLPFAITQRSDAFMHIRLLRIPVAGHDGLTRAARDFHVATLAPEHRYTRLIGASFSALAEAAPRLSGAEADRAAAHLAQLVLLARGAVSIRAPESRAALRAAHLDAARAVIARHLNSPDLSAETVATLLGVSLRQVHVLFEPTGMTLHRSIMAMRVAEACRLLGAMPERPVSEIAFACGFDSLATFYRVFRSIAGMSPSNHRQAVLGGFLALQTAP